MKTITLGPEGTFSHELALRLGCDPLQLAPTIHDIIRAVAQGDGQGIVPIENSEAGGVGETLDNLSVYPVYITGEMYMPIHHHLASPVPFEKIRVLYAHPQTHEQCSRYLDEWRVPVIHTSSNASSAMEAKKTPNAGAILSASAASIYRMPIIAEHIENNRGNVTRFVRIGKEPVNSGHEEKCSILIDPDTDRAGLLYELLGAFARRNINLTRIESRPSKRGIGKYVFFLDYAVSGETCDALRDLKAITNVKEMGCYARIEVP